MCKKQTNQKPDAVGVAVEPEVRFAEERLTNALTNWVKLCLKNGFCDDDIETWLLDIVTEATPNIKLHR